MDCVVLHIFVDVADTFFCYFLVIKLLKVYVFYAEKFIPGRFIVT